MNIIPTPTPSRAQATPAWRPGYGTELFDVLAEFGMTAGREILDVGCGGGGATEPLAVRGCILTGLDADPARLAVARERLPAIKLLQGRAEELPFAAASFDGAVCAHAFHRFDQSAAMAQLLRVVRPGRPVAIWWNILSTTDRAREAREHASLRVGRPPMPDALKGSFRAFFGAPFADHRTRVIRHIAYTTVDRWLEYERSREGVADHYGPTLEQYLSLLDAELRTTYGDGEMSASFIQYLFVGLVP